VRLLLRWAINSVAIILVAWLLPSVELVSWQAALIAGILLGVLNTFVRPIFRLVSMPINVLTLGLFTLVINAVILEILDWLMDGFNISGFLWSIVAAVLISIVTSVFNIIIGD
jgi:putative membrane protein